MAVPGVDAPQWGEPVVPPGGWRNFPGGVLLERGSSGFGVFGLAWALATAAIILILSNGT